MRRLGTTTRVRTCDACGKSDLASTVVFADGTRKVHLGADCARRLADRSGSRRGVLEGWRYTRSGYQITTIGGTEYATLFDLRNKVPTPEGPKSLGDIRGRVVEFRVGPGVAMYSGMPSATIVRVVGDAAQSDHARVTTPAEMPAAEINRALDRLDKENSKLADEFIAAGRGHERASETYEKTDPLAMRWKEVQSKRTDLRYEVERRAGPGMRRLPRGFGPLRRDFAKRRPSQWMRGPHGSRRMTPKAQATQRAAVVKALGLEPEGKSPGDKYPSTTGELLLELRERHRKTHARANRAVTRPPGITVATSGQVKRNGRLLGFVSGKPWSGFKSSTVSRTDGRTVYREHATREDAIAYVIAHGWAYGDPPKDTDERDEKRG